MKVLIWFLCIFANALITTLIKEAGIILGAIPTVLMFSVTLWLARTLCKQWDKHKENKAIERYVADQTVPPAPVANQTVPPAPVANGWTCTCGRNHAAYESSCVCGVTKTEAKMKNNLNN